ncbi:UTRA domain-containing protein [Streptomyces sp. Ac-502]|uniref:UTRA domain-containing protein n=1 Tax=Streptomyces sp. Ac-502 TaxID=3342801 RepID=UPI0038628E63
MDRRVASIRDATGSRRGRRVDHGEREPWWQPATGCSRRGTATPEVKRAFGLSTDEAAVVRRRVMRVNGAPVELTDSWYPLRVAAGTALAEPRKIRGGAPTLLAELGHVPHSVTEEVGIRVATDRESHQLDLSTGESVLTLLRVSKASDGNPIEVSLMVMKGPRQIRYEIEVD